MAESIEVYKRPPPMVGLGTVEERTARIVDTAVELAEQGGFEAVRLRDVASKAGVALGTVYKRFPAKEDILVAALGRVIERLEQRLRKNPLNGETPEARAAEFFGIATRTLLRKPRLARALIRAIVSGDKERSDRVVQFRGRSTALIVTALQGPEGEARSDLVQIAELLEHVWFASLVGWMGGLTKQSEVTSTVESAANLMIRGLRAS